jgi:hypothetical protein
MAASGLFDGQSVMMPLVASDSARRDSYRQMAIKLARMHRTEVKLIRLSGREEIETVWKP